MFRRRQSEKDFAREIESHLDLETDRLMAGGMAEIEARQAARKSFGNVTSQAERYHERRTTAFVDSAWRNLRYALRALARRPAFAAAAILTLAFGIGVNSALYTVLYAMLLRPPPVGDPSHFVSVLREVHDDGRSYSLTVKGHASMLSWPDYLRLRQDSSTLEQLAVYHGESFSLDVGDRSVATNGEVASCNYFSTTQVAMARGRAFRPEECAVRGTGSVVIVSYAAWQRRFGGEGSIVGRSLRINRHRFTVIGVAAPGFAGLGFEPVEFWLPVTMYTTLLPNSASDFDRDISWLSAIARLRPAATMQRVSAELTALARVEDANWPGRVSTVQVKAGGHLLQGDDRPAVLAAATGAVAVGGLILLMCCANVMNLLLARAAARRREIGIRLSLGASRSRLVAQLMVESGVLAFLGAALGLVLAWWLPPFIRAMAPDQELTLVLTPDVRVLAATLVAAAGAALLFGLVPALQSTSLQLTAAMRNDTATGRRRGALSRWRNAAVVAQVSISALLLVTAAMFLRATQRSFTVEPGFTIRGVTTLAFDLEQANYDSVRTRTFFTQMREQLAAAPGVRAVAVAWMVPLRGRASMVVAADGVAGDSASSVPTLLNAVSPDYFAAMGIPVVRGRVFAEHETGDPAPVVVSEAFAARAWRNANPLGHVIHDGARRLVVIGVARDIQSVSLGTPDGPYLYLPHTGTDGSGQLIVRADLSTTQLRALAQRVTRALDPDLIVTARGLDEVLQRVVAPVEVAGKLASGLGVVAMLLAAVGVYGVTAFSVSQRSREIGIRMALGATRRGVQAMMFREGARTVGVGLAIGIVLSIGSSQAIRSLLFGLSALDGVAFLTVAVLLSVVSGLRWRFPRRARRASIRWRACGRTRGGDFAGLRWVKPLAAG